MGLIHWNHPSGLIDYSRFSPDGCQGGDKLLGDNGDDTLNGGIGRDVCDGGLGNNTVRECE